MKRFLVISLLIAVTMFVHVSCALAEEEAKKPEEPRIT